MEELSFFEAYDAAFVPLANAVSLLDLLARLAPTGVLTDLREPLTAPAYAERAGLSEETAEESLSLLLLADVVRRDGDAFVLTPAWLALTASGAFVPLASLIAGQDALSRVVRDLGRVDYWQLPAGDRLALARAVSPDPYSDELVEGYRRALAADRFGSALLRGGRYLELGCGVAGRVLLTLRAVPDLVAVGVELSEDLAEEAERRARDLGVGDRFTVVCADAADFTDPEAFDFGFWSQFFFPDQARAPALATLMRSLRPGALFQAPLGEDPASAGEPETDKARAVQRVMLRSWGVPRRSADSLVDEIRAAGFTDVGVVPRPGNPVVQATRPR